MNEVLRQPYPRALVDNINYFGLLPNEWSPGPGGLWSPPQNPYPLDGKIDGDGLPLMEGLVRNLEVGLRAQRLNKDDNWLGMIVPDVNWTFTSASSKGDARVQQGITATYSYAAASFVGPNVATGAVPNRGRRFDLENKVVTNAYDLPAFPVRITTYCGFWNSVRLEQSVKYWQQTGGCITAAEDENGNLIIPAGMSEIDCPTGQVAPGQWRYKWVPKVLQDWTPIDMRRFNMPTTYVPTSRATVIGIYKGLSYREPTGNGIWVPVVEVQTVQQQ